MHCAIVILAAQRSSCTFAAVIVDIELSCNRLLDTGEGQKVMSKVEQWLEDPDFLNVVDPDAGQALHACLN